MAVLHLAVAWLFAHVLGARAASISSCGGPSDVFTPSVLSLSPDPISANTPFTVTAIGTLSKAFSGGVVTPNVDITAQVPFVKKMDMRWDNATMIALEPAVPEGQVKFVLGPVQLPWFPGHLGVTGTMTVVDEHNARVACLGLDLRAPLVSTVLQL